ncbi:Nucleolar complex protein [Nymphaea thermarum]|nr:Nucleolar complex protein [Nymphaea thermarum]
MCRTGKRKGNPYPLLPPDIGDDEIEVSDEDFEFLKENRDYAGFLKKLDTKSITRHVYLLILVEIVAPNVPIVFVFVYRHVVRLADDEKDDALELLYEKRRKVAIEPTEEDRHHVARVDALPIKTLEGKLCYRTAVEKTVESKNLVKDLDPKTGGSVVETETMKKKLTKAERRKQLKEQKKQARAESKEEKKRSVTQEKSTLEVLESVKRELSEEDIFEKKKTKLAEVGTSLLVDPEKNISSLKELLGMCNDDNKTIVKLGLLSLLAVFKDIIPGYHIRLPTEKELQMVVSKEVKRMRYYESMLLNSYGMYLQKLITLEKQSFFHHAAIHCLCCLLEAVPHFNLRESLLDIVVKNTNSSDDVTRKLCCDAVKSLFLNEGKHGGEATVEAVELVSDLVKSHDCQLHPDCVEVFLSLSFDEDLAKPEPVKEVEKTNRKRRRAKHSKADERQVNEKKQMKQELLSKAKDEVNADFRSVSFVPDPSERRKVQTQTLSAVFGTYFRILKHILGNAVSGYTDDDGRWRAATAGGFRSLLTVRRPTAKAGAVTGDERRIATAGGERQRSGSSKYLDVNPEDIDVDLEGEHDLRYLNMDLTEPVVPSNLDDVTEENENQD